MNPSTWEKQPWEERILEFDTSPSLAVGDSLNSVSSINVTLNGVSQASMLSGSPTIVGSKVYQKIIGGEHGKDYEVSVRIITTNGEKIEDDLTVRVRN
jgi:hypothetical protein